MGILGVLARDLHPFGSAIGAHTAPLVIMFISLIFTTFIYLSKMFSPLMVIVLKRYTRISLQQLQITSIILITSLTPPLKMLSVLEWKDGGSSFEKEGRTVVGERVIWVQFWTVEALSVLDQGERVLWSFSLCAKMKKIICKKIIRPFLIFIKPKHSVCEKCYLYPFQ